MINLNEFGIKIKELRIEKGLTITDIASAIGVSRPYLSKIESGAERPSPKVFDYLIRYFDLNIEDALQLAKLAGYKHRNQSNYDNSHGKEVRNMAMNTLNEKKGVEAKGHRVNVDPKSVPVHYTDSIYVTSSQWGIVFDFAQTVGPTEEQNVVARIGMSKEHASALIKLIQAHVDKNNIDNVKIQGVKN